MSKGSDNPYPSVLVVEGSAPASPSSGDQRLFLDSVSHHLKRVNSSGTVTDIEGAVGAITKLTETVLGSSVSTITLTSISGSYRALRVLLSVRSDNAGNPAILLQPNSDSTSVYDWTLVNIGNSTGATGYGGAAGDTSQRIGDAPGTSAPSNLFNVFTIDLLDYASTTRDKTILSRGGRFDLTSIANQYNVSSSGVWRSTAAITSLLFSLSAGNFISGTICSLYGIT